MEKTENITKPKKDLTPKTMSIIYIGIIICSTIVLIVLVVFAAIRINENNALLKRQEQIVEQYTELATENENLSDPDYANIYFDDENVYIPSQDIIIEFHG